MPAKKRSKSKFAKFFSNPRNVVIAVVLVSFALVGGYKTYYSSAATALKYPFDVRDCQKTGVTLGQGSYGECVVTLQAILNRAKTVYHHTWPTLALDKNFGPQTKAAVVGYQQRQGIRADGLVGPITWAKLVGTCNDPAVKPYCNGRGFSIQ